MKGETLTQYRVRMRMQNALDAKRQVTFKRYIHGNTPADKKLPRGQKK